MDSVEDTIASTPIKDSFHIDIEKLKQKPRVNPKDFPTRKEALAYVEERLDSVLKRIADLDSDMELLTENPTPSEVKQIANKWQDFAQGEAGK